MAARSILFVDHAPALGGAEHSLLLILKHLDRARWRPHLACVGGSLAERAQEFGVTVHPVEMPRLRWSPRFPLDWLGGARALARIARQIDAALIHSNTIRSTLYAAPAAKLARTPFIWHMRDFWLTEMQPERLWLDHSGKRLLCGLSAQVVSNSHAVAAHLPCSGKITVIHNGIETERFAPETDGRVFRAQYNIPVEAPVIGMVGRMRPWKGQDTFLQTAALIKQTLPTARFLIVGGNPFQIDDDYAERLRALTASLSLTNQVTFTGQLSDTRPALAAMDVFVHPGSPEPFGLVNIEAMAMAKPVVAFAYGALPEIVDDGITGLLIPPGNDKELAKTIASLLHNVERAQRMGFAGRRRVETHFDIHLTVQAFARTLDHITIA